MDDAASIVTGRLGRHVDSLVTSLRARLLTWTRRVLVVNSLARNSSWSAISRAGAFSVKVEAMMSRRVRVTHFNEKKKRGEKIAMLTAYDATMSRLLDRAGVDALLVGDSLGMVVLGYDSTLPVTIADVVYHTRAVRHGAEHALVIADMPFLSYHVSMAQAVRNAGRLIQEGGAAAVKLEGGRPVLEVVRRLVDIGIPVMGHLGLQPQSVHQVGGHVRRATCPREAEWLFADACALQEAGAFAVVLECIPDGVAQHVTAELTIPTIGIGAGPHCDGQILVSHDMVGLCDYQPPPFVKQYSDVAGAIVSAARSYLDDVRNGRFPIIRSAE
jgi:3-methyl-2-oxobutanoate hydroxymethyltransferase